MLSNNILHEQDTIFLNWLRNNKDLYKRAAMARKLHIPVEVLGHIIEHKAISQRYILQIKERMTELLLLDSDLVNDNNIVLKLYVLAMLDNYHRLPWLNDCKTVIYDSLVTLQRILVEQGHPLRFFISIEVNSLLQEAIQKRQTFPEKETR